MALDEEIAYLSIVAVSFSTLCVLFGIYFTLFLIAVWTTYQKRTVAYRRLKIVTLVLFLDLTLHFTSQAIIFARSRHIPAPAGERLKRTIPMTVLQGLTTTIAGLLSDGLLAWRFFVIFNKRRWARCAPPVLVLINALLALSANLLPLGVYHNKGLYETKLHKISLQILFVWGWYMFVVHTLLTGSIIWNIINISRPIRKMVYYVPSGTPYSEVALRAIIESSLITWIGLLMYEITSVAPAGRITTDLDVGYVMGSILPVFFGLSQCLITVRLAYIDSGPKPGTPQSSLYALGRQPNTLAPINTLKEQERSLEKSDMESPESDDMNPQSFESGAC